MQDSDSIKNCQSDLLVFTWSIRQTECCPNFPIDRIFWHEDAQSKSAVQGGVGGTWHLPTVDTCPMVTKNVDLMRNLTWKNDMLT